VHRSASSCVVQSNPMMATKEDDHVRSHPLQTGHDRSLGDALQRRAATRPAACLLDDRVARFLCSQSWQHSRSGRVQAQAARGRSRRNAPRHHHGRAAGTVPQAHRHGCVLCAGNRRADMQLVRPTSGDPWAPGAIGNAEWTGVALADVLRTAGAETDPSFHVAFDACDEVEMPKVGRFTYGASIPIAKAMSPEVLLAYSMNGEPLAPEHGYPLRVVVPGFAGVRSPKWLTAITVQDKPSNNHMQQQDYKLVPPDVTEGTVDWAKGVTIYDMPLNSAICEPASHAQLRAGSVILRGYAIATARDIVRVDVSIVSGALMPFFNDRPDGD
jgi:DMSO/TMAO reductase YedYZ molybdopterin-dependent catalytic subunit